jgi:hypothetical protein
LYVYWIRLLTAIFGNDFLVLRVYGIIERIILVVLIYVICRRLTSRPTAIIASILSVIMYAGFNVDPIYSYYQTCIIFVILSCYLALKYMDARLSGTTGIYLLLFAGVSGGLAFLVKQTTGLLVPCGIWAGIILFELKIDWRKAWYAGIYLIGFLLPVGLTYLALYKVGAFHEYVQQVFLSAAAAKGGMITVLFGAIEQASAIILYSLPIAFILGLAVIFQRDKLVNSEALSDKKNLTSLFVIAGVCVSIAAAYFLQEIVPIHSVKYFFPIKETVLLSLVDINFILCFIFFITFLFAKNIEPQFQWFFLLLVSLSIIYSLGISNVYNCTAFILAVGLCITLILMLKTPFFHLKNILVYGICFGLITGMLLQRTILPYWWWGWEEPPVYSASVNASLPLLNGFKLSKNTNDI